MRGITAALWGMAILTLAFRFPAPMQATSSPRTDSLPAAVRLSSIIPARPFPQHTAYHGGAILPSHISREAMDDTVRSFYRQWKQRYILPGCAPDEKYVWFEGTSGRNICVSEGQGYGMMIVALMAGFDSTAQKTFDDLYRYVQSHPSTSSPHLMSWMQTRYCRSVDGGTATDGDMDIAFALLLADAQWGRHSDIPYRQAAIDMIGAILREEINPVTHIVMECNGESPRSRDFFDMRSSDFMPDHIRAFRQATGDPVWDTVLDNNYRVFHYLQDTYSPDAGLVPDFIKNIRLHAGQGYSGSSTRPAPHGGDASSTPPAPHGGDGDETAMDTGDDISAMPAQPDYLESKYDGKYNFNACRVPWRVAADYLVSGDKRAAGFLSRINPWIRETTKDNPDNISAGYNLSGEDLPHRYFEALCFICPFAVAAMANPHNQEWLNKLWDYIVGFKMKDFDYYDNSIKMIDLIILSGNYWAPLSDSPSAPPSVCPSAPSALAPGRLNAPALHP